MILLCPPEKSTQFHYPLDPKKIRAEGSMHKDTTYQGSDRQDFYRHGKKRKQTNKTQTSTGFAIGNPVKSKVKYSQLPPCGHLAITDIPLLRTAAKSPAKVTDV